MVFYTGDKPDPELTKKLRTRQRTGFFDAFETPQKKARREQFIRQSSVRRYITNVVDSVQPIIQAARVRSDKEAGRRVREEDTLSRASRFRGIIPGFSERFFDRIDQERARREETERKEQELGYATAMRKFREVEQKYQPLTRKQSEDVLSDRPVGTERREDDEPIRADWQPGKSRTGTALWASRVKAAIDKKTRGLTLNPEEKYASESITRGTGIVYADIPDEQRIRLESLTLKDGRDLPLRMSAATARGRLLNSWQSEWQKQHPDWKRSDVDRAGAIALDNQLEEWRENLREADVEEDVIPLFIEIELRKHELLEARLEEKTQFRVDIARVNKTDYQALNKEEIEAIAADVDKQIEYEFGAEFKILHDRGKSGLDIAREMPIIGIGAGILEIADALVSPLLPIDPLDYLRRPEERGTGVSIWRPREFFAKPGKQLEQVLEGVRGLGSIIEAPLIPLPAEMRGTTRVPGWEDGRLVARGEERDITLGAIFDTGREVVGRPAATVVLPVIGGSISLPFRGGEEAWTRITGVEARGKLSQPIWKAFNDDLAEDIAAEVLNPANIVLALPFAGVGLRAGMGFRAASTRITANLLATGLEPGIVSGTLKGLAHVSKYGVKGLAGVPIKIRNSSLFIRGYRNLGGESGMVRIGPEGVFLTPEAERLLVVAGKGGPIKRPELVKAAKGEGIRLPQRSSNEALLEAMQAKKIGLERLNTLKQALDDSARITPGLRFSIRRVLEQGSKARLSELKALAKKAGIKTTRAFTDVTGKKIRQVLTKDELIAALDNLPGGPEELARIADRFDPRAVPAVADVPARTADEIPGPLEGVSDYATRRAYADIIQSEEQVARGLSPIESTAEIQPIRTIIEQEVKRVGRTAAEVWESGEYRMLGKRPLGTLQEGATPAAPKTMSEAFEFTRTRRFDVPESLLSPKERALRAADEMADFGEGTGGIGKPPRETVTGPPLESGMGKWGAPVIDTFEKFVKMFEASVDNKFGAIAKIIGRSPPARAMLSFFNPSPFFEGRVGAAFGGFLRKNEAVNNMISSIEQLAKRHEKSLKFGFKNNISQNLKSRTGKVVTPEHLLLHPDDVIQKSGLALTTDQRQYIEHLRGLLKQQDLMERAANVEKKLQLGDDMDEFSYFHREVVQAASTTEKEVLIRRWGEKLNFERGFQKSRAYTSMYEGMENGEKYAEGMAANVMARLKAGQMAILDQEAAAFLKEEGMMAELAQLRDAARQGVNFAPLKYMEMFNNISRPMVTNIDLGFMGLQLIPAFFRNPVAALRGGMMAFDGLTTNPKLMAGYIRRHLETGELERFFNAGGVWNQTEFTFEYAAKNFSLFSRGPFGRFNSSFANALNTASLETFKGIVGTSDSMSKILGARGVSKMITRAFGGFAPEVKGLAYEAQAAAVANKLTLRLNSSMMGIHATQMAGERSLLFAPQYYRAAFGLLTDSIQGGLRGAEARRMFGQMFAGFLGINVLLEMATGKGMQLNPLKRDFMTVQVGDVHIGPGGPFVAFLNLIGGSWRYREDLDKWDLGENPLLRWGRGRIAPMGSFITDILAKENYFGEKIDSPMDAMAALGDRFTPFFVQAGIDAYTKGVSYRQAGAVAAAEFFLGLRTWPLRPWEKRNDVRNEVSQEKYDMDYNADEMNAAQRSKVNEDPKVIEVTEEVNTYFAERGDQSGQFRIEEKEALRQITEDGIYSNDSGEIMRQDTTQAVDNGLFDRGEIDGQTWIDRYRDREDMFYNFRQGMRVFSRTEGFDEKEPTNPVDKAIDAYFDIKTEAYLDATGEILWDDYWAAKDGAYRAAIQVGGEEVVEYLRPIEEDPMVRNFKDLGDKRRSITDLPKYRFVNKEEEVLVDSLIEKVGIATAKARDAGQRNVPSQRKVLAAILQALPPEHDLYRIVAVALLRKTDETREAVWNPERNQIVMDNPMMVKFWVSTFEYLTEEQKLMYLRENGLKNFSRDYIEREGLEPTTGLSYESSIPSALTEVQDQGERGTLTSVKFQLSGEAERLFHEATREGGVSNKIIENIYMGAEEYREHPERGRDPDKFIAHEILERLFINRGMDGKDAHKRVVGLIGP